MNDGVIRENINSFLNKGRTNARDCLYLASELKELGIQADVANVHRIEEPQWENYDRVVIGASIRYGHYHSAFQEFVKKHATQLNSMPSAFYP